MQIILPMLPNPTDIVIQGEQLIPPTAPPNDVAWIPMVQGEQFTYLPLGSPVPCALIGQHEWYGILPREIGPMYTAGGELVMVLIGRRPIDVFVDPIQRWLSSVFQVDQSGFMMTLYDYKCIGAPEAFFEFTVPEPETMGNPVVTIPRGAIYRSGLVKRITVPILPASFGAHLTLDMYTESSWKFLIAGITKNSAGTPIGFCNVIVIDLEKLLVAPYLTVTPIAGITVSDVNGNYSVQVNKNTLFQAAAQLTGSPDVAGATDYITPPGR